MPARDPLSPQESIDSCVHKSLIIRHRLLFSCAGLGAALDLQRRDKRVKNALTFDLEDYFHVTAFADRIAVSQWDSCESRVETTTAKLLDLLGERDLRATFFVLGWVGEKFPRLVRQIARLGHEIACHSHRHRLVYELSEDEFREDTHRAKSVLEDAAGVALKGYRAPSFSITRESMWAFRILVELGFQYDSSVFPVDHPNYGIPEAQRFPFWIQTEAGSLLEFPMSTLALGDKRSPIAGGAYFRLLPYWYTRWGIRFINQKEGHPVCTYLHPWELDPEQPRVDGRATARLRHYLGLQGMERKFRQLLRDFEFVTLGSLVASLCPSPRVQESIP